MIKIFLKTLKIKSLEKMFKLFPTDQYGGKVCTKTSGLICSISTRIICHRYSVKICYSFKKKKLNRKF